MQIKTQGDLVEAVWINCNRISCVGSTSLYFINSDGVSLPPFYLRFLNKNFDDIEAIKHFFSECNKPKNFVKFCFMLNESGGFTVQDILLPGALSQKQGMDNIKVQEVKYDG